MAVELDLGLEIDDQNSKIVQAVGNIREHLDDIGVGESDLGHTGELGWEDVVPGEVLKGRCSRELPVGVPVHRLESFFPDSFAGAEDLGSCSLWPVVASAETSIFVERAGVEHRVVEKVRVDAAADGDGQVEEEELLLTAAAFYSSSI